METTAPTWRTVVMPLAFALTCLALSLVAWRAFDGTTPLQPAGYTFEVRLPNAAGLLPGSDVRTSGVVIGRVVEVERRGTTARITASLETRHAPIRTGARAVARIKSLLGEGYLEIAPGPVSAPLLPEGATLATTQVAPSQQLADVLEVFSPRMRTDMRKALAGLARAFDDRAEDFSNTVGWSESIAADGASLASKLDDERAMLRRLLRSSTTMFAALGDQQAALSTTIDAGDRMFAATASRDRALRATVRELPPFLRQLTRTATSVGQAADDLERAAGSLETVTPEVAPLLRDVVRYAPAFAEVLDRVPPVLASGRRAVPPLRRLAAATTPALRKSYPAFRELAPLLELSSANREEIIAVLGNVGSLLNGRMIGQGDRPVAYGTGVPTIWNELLGGWIRKLPTNRANPYLKPGGLHSLADEGLVRAYGCDHTGNPLYVPPTGTGVPPCKEQGPWTVQGKTGYYPNLTPAAP